MITSSQRLRLLVFVVALFCSRAIIAQDAEMNPVTNTYAITNANIVQAPGRLITNGTVVIKNGIIIAVGSNVKVPSDAHIIKGDSMYVYAGFIDGFSNAAVDKAKEEERPKDVKKMNPPYKWAGISPQNSPRDFLNPKSKDLDKLRSAGFALAQVAPHGRMLPGTTSIITLSGANADELVYEKNTGLYSQLQGAQGVYPNTVIGVMAKYRDLYRQAGYTKIHESNYAKNPSGMERPTNDRVLQAFYPVIDKKMPVIFKADGMLTTHRILALQQDLGFRLTLANVKEGWDVIGKIKSSNAKVFLSIDLPKDKIKESDDATEEVAALEARKKEFLTKHYSQAGKFEKSGVEFGFSTLGTKPADIQKNIRTMVENGLSENGALAALTTNAASILGLSNVAGTVDRGKLGNIVVTTDSYFAEKSEIKYVIVDGDLYEFKAKPKKKKGDGTGPVVVAGTWNYDASADDGDSNGKIIIEENDGVYSGSMTNSQVPSSAEITDGTLNGSEFTFKATFEVGGESVTVDVTVEISDDTFEGIIETPFGNSDLTGEREPDLSKN